MQYPLALALAPALALVKLKRFTRTGRGAAPPTVTGSDPFHQGKGRGEEEIGR